jgi:hypothetical protein
LKISALALGTGAVMTAMPADGDALTFRESVTPVPRAFATPATSCPGTRG